MMSKENQGEGNREAARHYNKATEEFVKAGKVEQHKKDFENLSEAEKAELRKAEEKGLEKAKEKDPAVTRDHKKPA
jgi:hypothetical protein